MKGDDLIMEITMEQGPGRETQVQPPRTVWENYFRIDLAAPPTLRLTRHRRGPVTRPVVRHHHVWTLEVPDAGGPPAIIRFHREGKNRYKYWLYRPGSSEIDHCEWLLDNFENPLWRKGRRWFII